MAKIKGIELRNVREFLGHEGEPLVQGSVYYKNREVGFYSQDSWGGMDIFNLDYDLDAETTEEINDIVNNYVGGKLFKKLDDLYNQTYHRENLYKMEQKGYEFLFLDLLELIEHENIYKKYREKFKNDNICIIYNDLFNRSVYNNQFDIDVETKFPGKTCFEYKSLKDFVID